MLNSALASVTCSEQVPCNPDLGVLWALTCTVCGWPSLSTAQYASTGQASEKWTLFMQTFCFVWRSPLSLGYFPCYSRFWHGTFHFISLCHFAISRDTLGFDMGHSISPKTFCFLLTFPLSPSVLVEDISFDLGVSCHPLFLPTQWWTDKPQCFSREPSLSLRIVVLWIHYFLQCLVTWQDVALMLPLGSKSWQEYEQLPAFMHS